MGLAARVRGVAIFDRCAKRRPKLGSAGTTALLLLGLSSCSTDAKIATAPPTNAAGAAGDAGTSGAGAGPTAGASGAPSAGSGGSAGAVDSAAFCAHGKALAGATVPAGFCVRELAAIAEPRTLLVAPNGDLFVGAPSTTAPGGANSGPGQILVVSDDDHDGVGEVHVFADHVSDVHGIALGGAYLYFTSLATVFRTPYTVGQRQETGTREDLGLPATFGQGRWTHGLALSVGGALLASSGEYSSCGSNSPSGNILQVTPGGSATVANGFRNPMYLRCHYKDELCAANELGEDQTTGAREKFLTIKPNTAYGYPCCFGPAQPGASGNDAACQAVAPEDSSFTLGDTPFGLDWEHDTWPAPYAGGVFVALHGSAYSNPAWAGAEIAFAPADPVTHLPVRDSWQQFVGGFGPMGGPLERPSDVTFSKDGRLFFADDIGGHVYYVARE